MDETEELTADRPKGKTTASRVGLSVGFFLVLCVICIFTYLNFHIHTMYAPMFVKEYVFENENSVINLPAKALGRKSGFVLLEPDKNSRTGWSALGTSVSMSIAVDKGGTTSTAEVEYIPSPPEQSNQYDRFKYAGLPEGADGLLTINADQNLTFPLTLEYWIIPLRAPFSLEKEGLL